MNVRLVKLNPSDYIPGGLTDARALSLSLRYSAFSPLIVSSGARAETEPLFVVVILRRRRSCECCLTAGRSGKCV